MNVSNVFNVSGDNSYKTSIVKVMFIFYILIMSNYTENLIAKQTREFINQNRYMQHLLGFMTLYVLITLIDDTIDTKSALVYSLFGYIWFIFSTKLDIHWSIIFLIALAIAYMYENDVKKQIVDIRNDNNLTDEQKKKLIDERVDTQSWILWTMIIITVLGTFFYSQKKQEQYGGGFDVFTYIFN